MRQSFKVSFYLRSNYENKEGKSPVMLRIFLAGAMSNLGSTKIFVDKAQWNSRTSRQKGRSSEALAVNASLDAISLPPIPVSTIDCVRNGKMSCSREARNSPSIS